MILFPSQKIVLITPPKCASISLHVSLPAYGGIQVYGPQGDDSSYPIGPHTSHIPSHAQDYRAYVVYRNPYDRLVSLWYEFARYAMRQGKHVPAFLAWVPQALDNQHSWFHSWNISRYVQGLDLEGHLDICTLNQGLAKLLGDEVQIPKLRESHDRPAWKDLYNANLLEIVHSWATADVRRWGQEQRGG